MIDFYSKPPYGFEDLVELVRVLRAPDGCPWDSVQTHSSIRRNFIEEVYEVCDAIDRQDTQNLKEELGDVLLHVVFHAGIAADAGQFNVNDVCHSVVEKMISRHPALFGGDANLDWNEIKRREKGQTSAYEEMNGVARSLPALWRAEKIQEKAQRAGVPLTLTGEEDPLRMVGDMLFSAVALARSLGVDPEQALNQSCEAFLIQERDRENLKDQAVSSAENVRSNEK